MLIRRFSTMVVLCCSAALAASAAAPAEDTAAAHTLIARFQYTELHMGVQTRIVLYAASAVSAEAAARAAFKRIAELEDVFSDYRPDSELMRLCAKSGKGPVQISDQLLSILLKAQKLAEQTDGAFDVTVGPCVKLWRQSRDTGTLPSRKELSDARKRVGYKKLRLDADSSTAELTVEGMLLDLGGIAKGYALDQALAQLKDQGISSALIEMGGDLAVSAPPPGQTGWSVRVGPAPLPAENRLIRDQAVSSSGDIYQSVEIDGKFYSHVVDPRTGLGLTKRIGVTVTAPDAVTSDSLATAINVLGPEKTQALLKQYPGATASVGTYF